MDSNVAYPPPEDTENGREFRKPSTDASYRKYRRYSPSSESSSDGSPTHDSKSRRKDDASELRRESRRDGDSHRYYDRSSSRNAYSHEYVNRHDRHSKHHDSSRHHGRDSKRSSQMSNIDEDVGRSRYSHKEQDKRKDVSHSESGKYNDKESSSPKISGSSRKQKFASLDDRDARKSERNHSDRKHDYSSEDRKKPKLLDQSDDADESKNDDASQSKDNSAAISNNFNTAKVAALKAAELVNKNLVVGGFMSTEQKKKLLWGSKKTTTTEEAGPKWNAAMFEDPDRKEKFNKLMGVKENSGKMNNGGQLEAEKQKEVQIDLEKQYTAGLRRRDGRTVGLGL